MDTDTVRNKSTNRSETNNATSTNSNDSAIEIKGSVFTLPVLKINTTDIQRIEHTLKHHLSQSLSFFKNAPIVIDLERTKQVSDVLDFDKLTSLLREQHLVPVAVQKGSLEQHLSAESSGLAILTGQSSGRTQSSSLEAAMSSKEIAEDVVVQPEQSNDAANAELAPTKVIKHPIRSGQRVYARGGDLILLGAVNAGAEVIADGNIHIYAPLRGRALAGVRGDEEARIYCHCFEAELVAIAGTYRVFEDKPPADIFQQAVQILLRGEQLDIVPTDH